MPSLDDLDLSKIKNFATSCWYTRRGGYVLNVSLACAAYGVIYERDNSNPLTNGETGLVR